MSSTSEPSRPAMRMPSMSDADFRVIVMIPQLSHRPVKSVVFLKSSPYRMSPTPKNLLHFEGGNALSAFRAQALLPRLQTVNSRITGVHARHVHWVWSDKPLAAEAVNKVEALLRYGDAYAGPSDGALIVVAPRLGTVSPWASKA